MTDTPDNEALRARLTASWDRNAAAWTDAVRTGAIASRRIATDRAILEAVLACSPTRVLDVGCGEGWLVRALFAQGVEAVGVDGSAPLITAAAALGGGTFHVARYRDLADGTVPLGAPFDVVACNFALLGDDLAPLLRALGNALTPGGAVVIQTAHPWSTRGDRPYGDGWRTETFDGFGGRFPAEMPWYYRTLASWVTLLRQSRFRIISLAEPIDPDAGTPLSLVLTATSEARSNSGH